MPYNEKTIRTEVFMPDARPFSRKAPKAPRPNVILSKIQRQVGGLLRTSARGVPLLVLADESRAVSMSYFPRTRVLRIFEGYGRYDLPQTRHTFSNWVAAKAFLASHFEDGTPAENVAA